MKIKASTFYNIIFFAILTLLIIPQTRKPIQVTLHKAISSFSPSPSVIKTKNRAVIETYNWSLKSLDGNLFNFNTTKNKVVLVNFWATWCPPCIAEMPSMQKLYNDYKDHIEFVFVSNENTNVIQKFLQRKGYTFTAYNSISKPPKPFQVASIPKTYLLNKTGHIIVDKTGASNWNSDKIRALIDDLIQ